MVDENDKGATTEEKDTNSVEPSANVEGSSDVSSPQDSLQNFDTPGSWDTWIQRGTIALGTVFLLIGGAFKLYNMRTYNEDFFAGQSYVGMVVGVVAIILGLAYNFLFFDDEPADSTE